LLKFCVALVLVFLSLNKSLFLLWISCMFLGNTNAAFHSPHIYCVHHSHKCHFCSGDHSAYLFFKLRFSIIIHIQWPFEIFLHLFTKNMLLSFWCLIWVFWLRNEFLISPKTSWAVWHQPYLIKLWIHLTTSHRALQQWYYFTSGIKHFKNVIITRRLKWRIISHYSNCKTTLKCLFVFRYYFIDFSPIMWVVSYKFNCFLCLFIRLKKSLVSYGCKTGWKLNWFNSFIRFSPCKFFSALIFFSWKRIIAF
jgi:hypothetical protein